MLNCLPLSGLCQCTWHLDREVYCTGLQNLGSGIAVTKDIKYPLDGDIWWVFFYCSNQKDSFHHVA